jgi:outer membrane immunogenic protein
MRRPTLGIVGAVCIASIASAADLPVKAPIMPVTPVYSWTGFYLGGHVGGLFTNGSGQSDPLPNVPFFGIFPISGNMNDAAFVGGVHAGYNWQVSPSWVVGIEADWSWTDAEASFDRPWVSIVAGVGVRPGTVTSMSIGLDWLATARGRIGYLITPTALLYFTGGAALADVAYSASATNEPPSTYIASTSFKKTVGGYVLGGGIEWALWSRWSLRTEYLFYRLNTDNGVATFNIGSGAFPPPLGTGFAWNDTDIHALRFGASYRF